MKSLLAPRDRHSRSEEGSRAFIPIDAPVDLPYDHPIAELGPGELFGEMTCMNYYPRSATVRAATDCTMLEMLRNVLDIMQRNKSFREQLDRTYKRRALDSHLARRAGAGVVDAGVHRSIARPRGTDSLSAGAGDLHPGRCCRQLLSGAPGLREGVRAAARRRNCAGLPAAGIVLRRDGVADRNHAHRDLHRHRSCRGGEDRWRRFPADAQSVSRRAAEAGSGSR